MTTLVTATKEKSYWISTKTLELWRRYFLYIDTGCRSKAGPRVRFSVVASAITDPEPHSHFTLRDISARSFNFTDTKQLFYSIWWCTGSHEDQTFDGCWSIARVVIKGKVPPLTAGVAFEDTQYAIEINLQVSVIWSFVETTFLGEFQVKKDKSERKAPLHVSLLQQLLPRINAEETLHLSLNALVIYVTG